MRCVDLSGLNLRGQDLSGLDLSGADLRRADLSGACLRGTNLAGAQLEGTRARRHWLLPLTAACVVGVRCRPVVGAGARTSCH